MQATFLCIICFSLIIIGHVGASEQNALMQLKQGFGNPVDLSSWNPSALNASPCTAQWLGVVCDATTLSVVGLRLRNMHFAGGNISSSIGDLPSLQILDLSGNGLGGHIPPEINKLSNLKHLDLSSNALTGGLPLVWSNLTKLESLTLTHNFVSGEIPIGLLNAASLVRIRLENNSLSGSIPSALFGVNLSSLRYFAIEFNNISGPIPPEIGQSTVLNSFYAAHNRVTGSIPETIGRLTNLWHFEVNNNDLSGPFPESFVNLTGSLRTFNFSYNRLSGQIPAAFSIKFHDPSIFVGNPSLCGSPLSNTCSVTEIAKLSSSPPFVDRDQPHNHDTFNPDPSRNRRSSLPTAEIVGGVLGGIVGLLLLFFLYIFISRRLKQSKSKGSASAQLQNWFSIDIQQNRRKGMYEVFSRGFQYCYEEIVANAGYFDTAHVVGKGRFATVYRSHLPDGTHLAVKVFRLTNVAANFEKEIELLASIRHRNLLSIQGYYTNPVEKAIFYDYIPTGTLYELLHGQANSPAKEHVWPDWPTRHRIALGVALAMAYLHRGCGYRIFHRDLTSSNILLDADMNPRVSDHGIVHLVSGQSGGAAAVVETPGYMAPEVLATKKYTEKADVYSYGVVLLELITGKKAVSYVSERAMSLTDWVVRLHQEGRGREVMDPIALKTCPLPEYVDKCLNLAVLCIDGEPNNRPTMAEIASVVEGLCPSPSPLRSPEAVKLDVPLLPR